MERHLRHPARRLLLWALPAMLSAILLSGCEIADPALPTYTTRLTIPLGEKRIDVQDFIEDEDYLTGMHDGALGFLVSGDPDTVLLDFDLGVDVPTRQVSGELGSFGIDIDAGTHFSFTLTKLYPAASMLDGQYLPVPDFHFSEESNSEDVPDLESAHIANGTLTVNIVNGLPVPVSDDDGDDRLSLDLLDPVSGHVLASVEFDVIEPGGHAQRTADLAAIELPGRVAIRISGGSPGSGPQPVLVDAACEIAVEAVFSDLEVTEAVAVVPEQAFTSIFSTPLPQDYGVVMALIDEGSLEVFLRNDMAIGCQAVVTWPAVLDLDGQPLQIVVGLAEAGEEQRTVDFAGHVVQAPEGQTLSELAAVVSVTSPGSEGQAVALRSDQGVMAEIGSGRIEFTSVTGTVPSLSYDLDPIEAQIELPDEFDGILLCSATMMLELTTTASLPALAAFDLVGINQTGQRHEMSIQEEIQAAEGGRAATTRIILNESNSTIVDFLNHMPTVIELSGRVEIGGETDQVGTVRRDDYALVSWQISAPVEVVIESSQLYGEPTELDLEQETREKIEDHFGAAEFRLEVVNHLPVGVHARLLMGTDPDVIKSEPLIAIGPFGIEAGIVGPAGNTVLEPVISSPVLSLSAAESKLLGTVGLQSILEVTLSNTEGDTVRAMSTDYVSLQGLIILDIEIHDNR
jgi:hypothetical protein